MPELLQDLWDGLSTGGQDAVLLAALVLPLALLWLAFRAGYAPGPLIRALLRRYIWVNFVFVALIAVSVGMSIGLIAQERALRIGSAQAANKFDMIISAPGSELTMMFAAIYLQPSNVPLVMGDVYAEITEHPRVEFAAPLAFGDSYQGAPVVGTTSAFVDYLSEGRVDGRLFESPWDAIAGASVDLRIGDSFIPAHGLGERAEEGLHADALTVVGQMPVTGSPWDHAILTPVEGVWLAHALGTGKAIGDDSLGPPYDPALFPGTPAVIVRSGDLASTYALQGEFNSRSDVMAFFPGTVLARLHNVMGDVRQAMTVMSTVTQALVAASVLVGLFILTRLYQGQLVLLRTLGAPTRFIIAIVWSQAVLLLALGTALGLGLGVGAAEILSRIVSAETGIAIRASLGWGELHIAAGFLSLSSALAVVLGLWAARSPVPTA